MAIKSLECLTIPDNIACSPRTRQLAIPDVIPEYYTLRNLGSLGFNWPWKIPFESEMFSSSLTVFDCFNQSSEEARILISCQSYHAATILLCHSS